MITMENLIEETLKTLSDEYDKLYQEQQSMIKKLEGLASKHQILSELKQRFTNNKNQGTPTGGTIIVKDKK